MQGGMLGAGPPSHSKQARQAPPRRQDIFLQFTPGFTSIHEVDTERNLATKSGQEKRKGNYTWLAKNKSHTQRNFISRATKK